MESKSCPVYIVSIVSMKVAVLSISMGLRKWGEYSELSRNRGACFEDQQIAEIRKIASEYTRRKLTKEERTGVDLTYLTSRQKSVPLTKKRTTTGRTVEDLYKKLSRLLETITCIIAKNVVFVGSAQRG